VKDCIRAHDTSPHEEKGQQGCGTSSLAYEVRVGQMAQPTESAIDKNGVVIVAERPQATYNPAYGLRPVMMLQYPAVGFASMSTNPASLSMLA